jgi:hypothetical protein
MAATTLAQDRFGHPVQAVMWGVTQNLAVGVGSAVASVPLLSETRVVRLCASEDCWVAIGPAAVVSPVTGVRLPAGVVEYVGLTVQEGPVVVSALGIAAAGSLCITQAGGG